MAVLIGACCLCSAVWANGAPGPGDIERRFDVREQALREAEQRDHPVEARLRTVLEAAYSRDRPDADAADVMADARYLLAASERFGREGQFVAWGESLLAAVRLDLRLPSEQRRIGPWEIYSWPGLAAQARAYGVLADLALAVTGDDRLAPLLPELAAATYFNGVPWARGAEATAVAEQCDALLRLVEALQGVDDCRQCSPAWRWRPLLNVALGYNALDRPAEARATMARALAVLQSIPDARARVSARWSALPHMLGRRYDPAVTLEVARAYARDCDSLEAGASLQECRDLPVLMQRAGFADFR